MTSNTKCPQCSKGFPSVEAMRAHFQQVHRQAPTVEFTIDVPPSTIDNELASQRCENCKFLGRGNQMVVCRRHPGTAAMMPGPTGALVCVSLFVPVNPNEWCGEWEAGPWPTMKAAN